DPARSVERQRREEDADDPVQPPPLEEADRDDGDQHDDRGDADHDALAVGADFERVGAEHDQRDQRPGDHRRVDRAAPLLRPVDVFEVDPEGELVDRQPGADAEEEGADLEVGTLSGGGEAEGPGDHHRHDPEDEVVDVEAAFAFDVARPPTHFGADHPGAEADEGERADETDEHQEYALAAVVDEVLVPEVGDEVGQRQSGAHAASPETTGSGRRFRTGPLPSRAWIRSSVNSTIATEKTGAVAMLPTASPIQAGIRPWPRIPWTPSTMNSLSVSPTVSIGMTTAATIQKWPRTRWKLRLKPPT